MDNQEPRAAFLTASESIGAIMRPPHQQLAQFV